ncbi:MAG: hypothetical protein PV340_03610 [Wolbachia sp.]|nr:hypothetical protein [Wolbachia sp.]MDD9336204.1 hypothetical protein [Wolbachia sp.]
MQEEQEEEKLFKDFGSIITNQQTPEEKDGSIKVMKCLVTQ